MKRNNRRKVEEESGHSVWRSYSDMMSGLLLLFILIMAVCLMQAQKNYTEKLAEQAKQAQTQNQLEQSQSTVAQQESELAANKDKLDEQAAALDQQSMTLEEQAAALEELQKTLENQQKTLDDQAKTLEAQQTSLNEKESELDASQVLIAQQESELTASQAQLAASQSQLDEANELMSQQQARIDQIIGVKADLIEALDEEFKQQSINVQIDTETGAILLDSSVLFEFNMSTLTQEGSDILDTVLPIYCSVLMSSKYADYVGEIIIEGYTDTSGDYLSNLDLSQNRAYAVAEYLYGLRGRFLSDEEADRLVSKITANGRSMSNPILNEDGSVNMDASRRVEIKFRLKDEEMLTELQKLIEQTQEDAEKAGITMEIKKDE